MIVFEILFMFLTYILGMIVGYFLGYNPFLSKLQKLEVELVEMKRCKTRGLCCGAGGAQMFKEPEKGDKDINVERTEEALETQPSIIAAGCPFCNTMMTDGVKAKHKEDSIQVLDVAEMIANAADL